MKKRNIKTNRSELKILILAISLIVVLFLVFSFNGKEIKRSPNKDFYCSIFLEGGDYILDTDLYCDLPTSTAAINLLGIYPQNNFRTTLDCNNHKIVNIGNNENWGIRAMYFNVSMKNCKITNFSSGIYAPNLNGSIIEGNTLENNKYGIYLAGSFTPANATYNIIRNNIIRWNQEGISIFGNSNFIDSNTIEGSNTTHQQLYGEGLVLRAGSSHNRITNNIVQNNSRKGVYIYDLFFSQYRTLNNTIENNIIINNGIGTSSYKTSGITIEESSRNSVIGNTFRGNQNHSISIIGSDGELGTRYNTILSNQITDNEYGVVILGNSRFNNITNNLVCRNHGHGVSDFICVGALNTVGNANLFDKVDVCDDGWPTLGIDYVNCPHQGVGSPLFLKNIVQRIGD